MKTTLRLFVLSLTFGLLLAAAPRANADTTNWTLQLTENFEGIGGSSIGDVLADNSADSLYFHGLQDLYRDAGNGGGLGLGVDRPGGNSPPVIYTSYTSGPGAIGSGQLAGDFVSKYGSFFRLQFDAQVNDANSGNQNVLLQVQDGFVGSPTYWYIYLNQWTPAEFGTWKTITLDINVSNSTGWASYGGSAGFAQVWSTGGDEYHRTAVQFSLGALIKNDFTGPRPLVIDNLQIFAGTISTIPEPDTLLAFAAGLAGLLALRARRRAN